MKQLFYILLLIYAPVCFGQFSDSIHHYVKFSSGGSYNRTNIASSYLLNNSLSYNVKQNKMSYNFVSKWLYGNQNKRLVNNDFNSTFDANLYKTFKHFNYWGIVNYTSSYSLKIVSQFQTGIGGAYSLIDTKTAGLNLSYGIIFEYGDIILKNEDRQAYNTFRHSVRLKFKWDMGTRVSLSGNGFFQPSVEDFNDYIIRSDAHIALKLKKWLSITAGFTYNEVRRIGTQNLLVTYGLIAEKYF